MNYFSFKIYSGHMAMSRRKRQKKAEKALCAGQSRAGCCFPSILKLFPLFHLFRMYRRYIDSVFLSRFRTDLFFQKDEKTLEFSSAGCTLKQDSGPHVFDPFSPQIYRHSHVLNKAKL